MFYWIGALCLLGSMIGISIYLTRAYITNPLPRPDYSETNVRLWCENTGLEVRRLKRGILTGRASRVRFRLIVENEYGERRACSVISDRDRLDAESANLAITWRRMLPSQHQTIEIKNDPLWDNCIDGATSG